MARSLLTILLTLAIMILPACETVVDVSIPAAEPQLVAQGFFTTDSLWAVRVHRSVDFASPIPPGLIDDATVNILENGIPRISLPRADSGGYLATGFLPVSGATYTLQVEAPGFPITSGSDVLPFPPNITSFKAAFVTPDTPSISNRRIVGVSLTIDDPADERNYYGLMVIQIRAMEDKSTNKWQMLQPTIFLFESEDPILGESDFGFLNTDKETYFNAFFGDDLFDGQTHTLDFSFQYDVANPSAEIVMHRSFGVLLLSVSEHFYNYWKTAGRQAFTNENPFAEPLRVHSNMTGGPGIFAGFDYRMYPAALDTLSLDNACQLASNQKLLCERLRDRLLPPQVLLSLD